MKCEKYPLLFEPTKIGNIKLKNRIAMSAMGTGFANHDGTASDRIIRYYEERAKGGAGLIFTEICRIDGETGLGNFNQLGAYEGYQMKSLRSLTEAVHRHDTKIFLQLHHPGRVAQRLLLGGKQAVAPSAIPDKVVAEMPRELTTEECEALVKKFCVGAYIAKAAGFDGIELHAAHGYLINQFMSPYSNKRTDKYGGNFIGRMRCLESAMQCRRRGVRIDSVCTLERSSISLCVRRCHGRIFGGQSGFQSRSANKVRYR